MQIKGYVVPRRKQNGIRLIKPERVPGDLPSMNTGLDELSWILQINHSLHPGEEGGAYQCPDLHSQARPFDLQVPQAEPSSRAASAGKAEKTTSSPSHYTWLTTHTVLRGQAPCTRSDNLWDCSLSRAARGLTLRLDFKSNRHVHLASPSASSWAPQSHTGFTCELLLSPLHNSSHLRLCF